MNIVIVKMLGTDLTYKRPIYSKDLKIGQSFSLNGMIDTIKLLIAMTWAEQIIKKKSFCNALHAKWLQEHYQILKACYINNSD